MLTRCALSGVKKHIDLPEMSSPLQITPQLSADLNSTQITVTKLNNFPSRVRHSPWNQHAWTLQEASLSRCLLCFIDQSVSLVCRETIFHDAIEYHDPKFKHQHPRFPTITFPYYLNGFDCHFRMTYSVPVLWCYTQRQLTKQSDALAAVSGLLARIFKSIREEFFSGQPKTHLVQSLI
jgi:hypothetical protein